MKLEPRKALHDKVVIVTGASSGIGEASARAFARAGARVVLAARRMERLERLASEIRAEGGVALPVQTDVTNERQIATLVHMALSSFGRIDVLANIAGWGRYDWIEELTPSDLRQQYEVNVIGMAELIRQVVPVMKAQRSGVILNMSSYASRIAVPPLTIYASTKYAVEGLSDGLRRELLPWGISVVRVHPSGVTGTEFNPRAERKGGIRYRSFPIGRVSRERVADEIVRLAERPRRALFLSRLYDVPVFLNRAFPGLVDRITAAWVARMRRAELAATRRAEAPAREGSLSIPRAAGAMVVIVGLLGLWRSWFHARAGETSAWVKSTSEREHSRDDAP